MNVIEQAKMAYAPTQFAIRTDRSIEAQLIGQITARLSKAADQRTTHYPDYVAALFENRRIWTTLAAEVADKNNELPNQLRAQIFYLAEFADHHTRAALSEKADPTVLIDINRSVLQGLTGQGVT